MLARGRRTIEEMFERGFSADNMCSVIKDALTLLFDAHVPDATTPAEVLVALRHPNRDNIYCGGAHALQVMTQTFAGGHLLSTMTISVISFALHYTMLSHSLSIT